MCGFHCIIAFSLQILATVFLYTPTTYLTSPLCSNYYHQHDTDKYIPEFTSSISHHFNSNMSINIFSGILGIFAWAVNGMTTSKMTTNMYNHVLLLHSTEIWGMFLSCKFREFCVYVYILCVIMCRRNMTDVAAYVICKSIFILVFGLVLRIAYSDSQFASSFR